MESSNEKLFGKIEKFIKQKRVQTENRLKEDWNRILVKQVSPKGSIPSIKQLQHLREVLTKKEKYMLRFFTTLALLALVFLAYRFYVFGSEHIADYGGEYIEALVGEPELINPVLATTETDGDMARLIYSSLFHYNENMELVPDLVTTYEVSEDGKTYTLALRENVMWHDTEKFDSDDVIFTFNVIKEPEYRSTLQGTLRGVTIEKKDDFHVTFTLKEPYAPFLSSLVFGILPEHQWASIQAKNFPLAKLNIEPVGSGPFRALTYKRDDVGKIRQYTLTRNDAYYGQKPYLEKVTLKFYSDFYAAFRAFSEKHTLGISFLPQTEKQLLGNNTSITTYSLLLPQYTALFFNLKDTAVFKDEKIRQALAFATNREEIVTTVFSGEAKTINGPILPGQVGYKENIAGYPYDAEKANTILEESGWKRITSEEYKVFMEKKRASEETTTIQAGETRDVSSDSSLLPFYRQKGNDILSLKITTVESVEFKTVAELIANSWRSVGIETEVVTVNQNKIHGTVIKPRLYDVLLYAEVVGSDPDPYPYWHSSQATDTGLNLSLFNDKKVDTLLEEARLTNDFNKRAEKYHEFQDILNKEIPAIFLYYPTYTYAVYDSVHNINARAINLPSDRFSDIEKRSIKTKRIFHWERWKEFFMPRW